MPDTCLFTGEELDDSTKVEHVIPKCLGGRITSKTVASTTFNERWGNSLIPRLRNRYLMIMNKLGPLLPGSFRSGTIPVEVPGMDRGLALDPYSVLYQKDTVVTERHEDTKRPKTIIGQDYGAIRKSYKADLTDFSYAPLPNDAIAYPRSPTPIIHFDLELAALISLLLTFDYKLADFPEKRFTRSDDLSRIRNLIGKSVVHDDTEVHSEISTYFRGYQYENFRFYNTFRDQINIPKSPFEHMMLVQADQFQKSLNMVWIILGYDPIGFQIRPWSGKSFAYAITNGILADDSSSPPKEITIPSDRSICRVTNRISSFTSDRCPTPTEWDYITAQVAKWDDIAFSDALVLIERQADDHIIDMLKENVLSNDGLHSKDVIRCRLESLYTALCSAEDVDGIIERIIAQEDVASIDIIQKHVITESDCGSELLSVYRKCFEGVLQEYGPPKLMSVREKGIESYKLGDIGLGDTPERS